MRKTFGFHGGIHPPENKRQSVRTPIAEAGIPPELIIPLSQHIGAPTSPVVTVGERVLKGQVIAEGPPHDVMGNEAVIDAYLGTHHDKPLTDSGEALTAHHEEA